MTIPDTSPTLGWGPSARSVAVNFVSAKKLWTCLATEAPVTDVAANYRSHPCLSWLSTTVTSGNPSLSPPTIVAIHQCVLPVLWPSIIVASHYCGRPSLWPTIIVPSHSCAHPSLCPPTIVSDHHCALPSLWPPTIVADHHCGLRLLWPTIIVPSHHCGLRPLRAVTLGAKAEFSSKTEFFFKNRS